MAPSEGFTKSQIDRLGDQLRKDTYTEADLRLLDRYRRSFTEASEHVVKEIHGQLGLEPTARPAKSTISITEKLRRESIRLSQMQDVAGCRLIVEDTVTQNEVVKQLNALFERCTIVDRREHPSHGYRAVHIVIRYSGKLIEVQVRTSLQHLWAEVCEKIADVVDPSIKYGIGDNEVLLILAQQSEKIMRLEAEESELAQQVQRHADPQFGSATAFKRAFEILDMKKIITQVLNAIGEDIPRLKGRKDDLSD